MPESTALEITNLPIRDLRPDPANPRRMSDEELESLTRSIREFGLIDPIIARREDKVVIGGHQRLLAARKLGTEAGACGPGGPIRGASSSVEPGPQQNIRKLGPGAPGPALG